MKPSSIKVRILVNDFKKMFDFYKDIMEYDVFWGDREGTYASFNIPGEDDMAFAIYVKEDYSYYEGYSDIGNQSKSDYIVMTMGQEDVDGYYEKLKTKGVEFIGTPRNIPEWYCRVVLLRDPEGNLIDIAGPLKEE